MTGMAADKSAPRTAGSHGLDDVSKSIIAQLQQDGRRSYASIGKAVGLSEAAVRQRVQRLTEAGIMQIVAVTDPLQLGFGRQAMVGVHVDGAIEPVADHGRGAWRIQAQSAVLLAATPRLIVPEVAA